MKNYASEDYTEVTLTDLLVVEGLSEKLVNVDALSEKVVHCNFTKQKFILTDTNDGNHKFGYGEARSDGLRYLVCYSDLNFKAALALLSTASVSIDRLNDGFAHTAKSSVHEQVKNDQVDGVAIKGVKTASGSIDCESCADKKIIRGPFKGTIPLIQQKYIRSGN